MKESIHLKIALAIASVAMMFNLGGCNQDFVGCGEDGNGDPAEASGRAVSSETPEGAYYDHDAGCWLVPINDPYELSNVQLAFENLMNGSSPYSAGVLSNPPIGAARHSHYHLKLFPATEEQLDEIYAMRDVQTNSYPFDRNRVDPELTAGLPIPPGEPGTGGRYWVYPEEPEPIDGEMPEEYDTEPFLLPVIYAVWPESREIPADLDHEILYYTCLTLESTFPQAAQPAGETVMAMGRDSGSATDSDEATSSGNAISFGELLVEEARRLANGDEPAIMPMINPPGGGTGYKPGGWIVIWDDDLNRNVPVKKLHVRVKEGSKHWECWTDDNGSWGFDKVFWSSKGEIQLLMRGGFSAEWTVTNYNGTRHDLPGPDWRRGAHNFSTPDQLYIDMMHIHRAATMFYDGDHPLYKNIMGRKIRYYSDKGTNTYHVGTNSYARIHTKLGTNRPFTSNEYFSMIGHELGHGMLAAKKGKVSWRRTSNTIHESFSCFVGWYLMHLEYTALGYEAYDSTDFVTGPGYPTDHPAHCRLCLTSLPHGHVKKDYVYLISHYMNRQEIWKSTINGDDNWYTPFFIDLVDDSNQQLARFFRGESDYLDYPNDNIKDVPVTVIQRLAINNQTMAGVVSDLRKYIGTYFTQKEFDDFMVVYREGLGL